MHEYKAYIKPLILPQRTRWTGYYRIECDGLVIEKTRYPENRMSKVLLDMGYSGKMMVYGPRNYLDPNTDIIHRVTVDIAKYGRKRQVEDSGGIGWRNWSDRSLLSLRRVSRK